MAMLNDSDDIDDDVPFAIIGLTRTEMLKALQSAFQQRAPPVILTGKRIDEGVGYMAVIARLNFTWSPGATSGGDAPLPTSAIVKIPTALKLSEQFTQMNNKAQSAEELSFMTEMVKDMGNREGDVYSIMAPRLNEKTRKVNIPMAMLYGFERASAGHPGYLLMEDLGGTTYVPDFMVGLPWEHTKNVTTALATYHAYMYSHPELLEGKLKALDPSTFENFLNTFKTAAAQMRKNFPDIFKYSDEDFFRLASFKDLENMFSADKRDFVPIVTHGDMWTNNFMFKLNKTPDGSVEKTAELVGLIDMQVAHPGLITEDICHLTAFSLDPELRREKTPELLDHYYSVFKKEIAGGKPVPFTRDQLDEYYTRMFPMHAFVITGHSTLMLQSAFASESPERRANMARRAVAAIEDGLKCLDKK